MFVPREKIRQDDGRCKLVCFIPIINQLLPPSVRRVDDVGRHVRSWEWRSAEDKRLREKAAEHGMHGILPLKEVPFVVQLVIAIFHGVSHQGHSQKRNEDFTEGKNAFFHTFKNESLNAGHLLSRRVLSTIVSALTVAEWAHNLLDLMNE